MNKIPLRGTLLNTLTVLVGSTIGLLANKAMPAEYQSVAFTAIGLVTIGFGAKMFLGTRNMLMPAIAMVAGGILGLLIGLDSMVAASAEWARSILGGGGTFNEGLITASLVFCVGPMTLLGCIKDGLEHDSHLLAIKSTLDLVSSTVFAATLGVGVLASAAVVFVVQGAITLLARQFKEIAQRPGVIDEASAAGGLILIAIGLNLLGVTEIKTEVFLLALIIAPLLAPVFVRSEPVA